MPSRRLFLQQITGSAASLLLSPPWPGLLRGSGPLDRSTPEAQGVSSNYLLGFIEALNKLQHDPHSLMILRYGYVIAEGWWSPYRADQLQTLYSLSKSFTSTAIGMAVKEGKLNLNDKVIDFFPAECPDPLTLRHHLLRIKHLLTMSVGHGHDTTFEMTQTDDWVKAFLNFDFDQEPGHVFLYNSGATYMLSAILQKVSGQNVLDFLQKRLFDPLSIEKADWERDPHGRCTGGWGLRLHTEDLAKFGQLMLQRGRWGKHQLLTEDWVREATSAQILSLGGSPDRPDKLNDWKQGYGYQFWRSQHGNYRGDGAFGQYCVILPNHHAVVVMTSESADMQGELDLMWRYLLPAMRDQVLPTEASTQVLRNTLQSLAIAPPSGVHPSAPWTRGRFMYYFDQNEQDITKMQVILSSDGGKIICTIGEEKQTLAFGLDRWISSEINWPGMPPKLIPGHLHQTYTVASAARWKDESTLEITSRFINYQHKNYLTIIFTEEDIEVSFNHSLAKLIPSLPDKRETLIGLKI